MHLRTHTGLTLLAAAALAAPAAALAAPGAETGPSSSESPYVVRSQPGVVTKSILTVGDSVNLKPDGTPYRLVGLPDGLGAYDNGDGTFTLLANHELSSTAGIVRAHGSKGSFVSRWTIDKSTLEVEHGEDLIQRIAFWSGDAATGTYGAPVSGTAATAINRLCSADLPGLSALFNPASGMGYNGRLFLDGEESTNGRAFAHAADGTSYELAQFGNLAYENSVANPATGDKTVVVSTDDTSDRTITDESGNQISYFGGQVYIHHGTKKSAGSPAEKAGLTGGTLLRDQGGRDAERAHELCREQHVLAGRALRPVGEDRRRARGREPREGHHRVRAARGHGMGSDQPQCPLPRTPRTPSTVRAGCGS